MMLLEHRDGHVLYIRARRMATVCYGYQRAASDGTQLQTRYAGVVQTTFHTRPSTTRLHLRPPHHRSLPHHHPVSRQHSRVDMIADVCASVNKCSTLVCYHIRDSYMVLNIYRLFVTTTRVCPRVVIFMLCSSHGQQTWDSKDHRPRASIFMRCVYVLPSYLELTSLSTTRSIYRSIRSINPIY